MDIKYEVSARRKEIYFPCKTMQVLKDPILYHVWLYAWAKQVLPLCDHTLCSGSVQRATILEIYLFEKFALGAWL